MLSPGGCFPHVNLYSIPWGGGSRGRTLQDKGWWRSQFHSTISPPADKATMTVETRACHPKGTGPPLQVLTKQTLQTLSCLSKPFQAIPGKAKHADSGIELLQQIGAFSWSVSAVQEFCDSEFAEGNFSWIARIVMPGPQMIGSIFILYSPCLCLLTFALKFSTLYFSLSNLLFCRLKVSRGGKKCKDWRKGDASLATSLPAVASSP